MENQVEINNPILDKLAQQLMDDVQVNIMNVRDKAMLVSTIRTQWVMRLFKEREIDKKLKQARKNILEKGVEDLQTSDVSNRRLSRVRLEEQILSSDVTLQKIKIASSNQAEVLQFIEYALNIIGDFNFTVKHALDAIKLEQS